MKRVLALLAIAAVLFGIAGHLEAAPAPSVRPAATSVCSELRFLNNSKGAHIGGSAWCPNAQWWAVAVGCSSTRYGSAAYKRTGPQNSRYESVAYCPANYPYAVWVSAYQGPPKAGFTHHAGMLRGTRPSIISHQYPSDCFHRKLSWTLDYATGTCAWVPPGASFVEAATCQAPDGHRYTVYGIRRYHAYQDSTATCPGLAEMVGAYNVKWAA